MYKRTPEWKTSLSVNQCYEGETLELKIARMLANKEPIGDGAPLIYTERKDGVIPGHDIRTDRFDVALDATDAMTRTKLAQRGQRLGDNAFEDMTDEQKGEHLKKYPKSKHAGWKPSDNQPS